MKKTFVSCCLLKKSNKILITSRPEGKFLSGMIYLVEFWTGKIKLKEKQQLRWLNRKDIKQFKYLPGSQIIFDRIYENYYKIFK